MPKIISDSHIAEYVFLKKMREAGNARKVPEIRGLKFILHYQTVAISNGDTLYLQATLS